MVNRAYGQFCGFSRALEIVGERWALLIIRDLLVQPKRFTDLRRGLPGIPTNILTARLKELEAAGIVERRVLPRPDGSVVYELTKYGAELDEVVDAIGRWGAKSLDSPRPGEVVTVDSIATAMRTTFHPKAARGFHGTFELRIGEIVINMRVDGARLTVAPGALPEADLVIETGPAIKAVMMGEMSPAGAIASGSVKITGDQQLFERFAAIFHIDM
jgi:DNA-binding HxlR family transcriptional regulator